MVVWGRCAVGAEEAVDWVATVALVGVYFQVTLGELEGVLGTDLVQGVFSSGLHLAGITMAENVGLRFLW